MTHSINQVEVIAASLKESTKNDSELVLKTHNYVRDQIKFGWTTEFDQATPEYTLARKKGHCVPQAWLFHELLSKNDIKSRVHYVVIDKDILWNTFPAPGFENVPNTISHAFTEVMVNGSWCSTDSYILDPRYFFNARSLLEQSEREVGYGLHKDGVIKFNGRESSFVQYASSDMMVKDLGIAESNREHKEMFGVIHLSSVTQFMPKSLESKLNSALEQVRWNEGLLDSIYRPYSNEITAFQLNNQQIRTQISTQN